MKHNVVALGRMLSIYSFPNRIMNFPNRIMNALERVEYRNDVFVDSVRRGEESTLARVLALRDALEHLAREFEAWGERGFALVDYR